MVRFRDKLLRIPMKIKVLASSLAITAGFLAPQHAHAVQVTTGYIPFSYKATQTQTNPNPTVTPTVLTFPNFASFNLPGTLKNVVYKLAADAGGTGDASATGQIRASTDSSDPTTVTALTYTMNLNFPNSVQLSKPQQSDTNLTATPGTSTTNNPDGSVTIDAGVNRNMVLDAPFSGVSNSWGLQNQTQTDFFTNGTVSTTSYVGIFNGLATNIDTTFNATSSAVTQTNRAMLSGWIALVYDYEPPIGPTAAVPGPLSMLGAAAAFGWSRKLRHRISSQA